MPKTKWVQTNKDNTQKEAINFSFVEWKNLTAEENNRFNCVEFSAQKCIGPPSNNKGHANVFLDPDTCHDHDKMNNIDRNRAVFSRRSRE